MNNNSILHVCLLLSTLLLFSISMGCSRQDESGTSMRIGWPLKEKHPSSQGLDYLKKELEEQSPEMSVTLYPNSQLGSAQELINSTRSGNVEACLISSAIMARHVPEVNAFVLPFLFRSAEHQFNVVDGKVGQMMSETIEKQTGLKVLGYYYAGFRSVVNKERPIQKPADLNGLKIRVMQNKLLIDTLNKLGASATPMPQGEVFTALKQGVIDGWENNPPTVLQYNAPNTNYYSYTRHLSIPDLVLVNKEFYEQLSEKKRSTLEDVAKRSVEKQREFWDKRQEQAEKKLKDKGMEFNELDTKPFREKVQDLYKEAYDRYGEEMREYVEMIKKTGQ